MIRYLILSFLLLITFSGCRFNPNIQGEGNPDIQGEWDEREVLLENERLQFSKHHFKFTCDSVYLTIETFAKVNTYPDSCFNNGRWKEYAKGIYETRNDTLLLTTTFTKENFKQKISGCYRNGQYLPAFIITGLDQDTLKLESLQQHIQLTLYRTQKNHCIPQPL